MNRSFRGIWIPAEIWLNKELTVMEKLFLVEIDSLDNEEGCFARNEYFAEFFGLSKSRCSEIIKSLEKKELVTIKYTYKENTKMVEKRIIKTVDESVRNLNKGIRKTEGGLRNIERGSSENTKDNNTVFNNTNNSKYVYKEKGKEFAFLYEKNIGEVNDKTITWINELCEQIDVELFERAIEIATDKNKCNQGYIKGIIKKWLPKGITTLGKLKDYEDSRKNLRKNSINKTTTFIPKVKTRFHNVNETFTKYSEAELEEHLFKQQVNKGLLNKS